MKKENAFKYPEGLYPKTRCAKVVATTFAAGPGRQLRHVIEKTKTFVFAPRFGFRSQTTDGRSQSESRATVAMMVVVGHRMSQRGGYQRPVEKKN